MARIRFASPTPEPLVRGGCTRTRFADRLRRSFRPPGAGARHAHLEPVTPHGITGRLRDHGLQERRAERRWTRPTRRRRPGHDEGLCPAGQLGALTGCTGWRAVDHRRDIAAAQVHIAEFPVGGCTKPAPWLDPGRAVPSSAQPRRAWRHDRKVSQPGGQTMPRQGQPSFA